MGIGAALISPPAGYAFDHFGSMIAFLGLGSIAAAGLAVVDLLMPETRPEPVQINVSP